MSRIRYLDISELNDRLEELEAKRDLVKSEREEMDTIVEALEAARESLEDASSRPLSPDQTLALEDVVAACERDLLIQQGPVDRADADFPAAEQKELEELESLRDEVGESRGKIDEDGGPFVDEYDFTEYARDLAEDVGDMPRNARWPFTCIDWEKAAEELKQDYSTVTFQGRDYLYRS